MTRATYDVLRTTYDVRRALGRLQYKCGAVGMGGEAATCPFVMR